MATTRGRVQSSSSLAISYDRTGNTLRRQRQYEPALKAYRDALAIRERLAKLDSGGTVWQSLLVRSYNRVALIQATCQKAELCNGTEAVVNATKACELTDWKNWRYS